MLNLKFILVLLLSLTLAPTTFAATYTYTPAPNPPAGGLVVVDTDNSTTQVITTNTSTTDRSYDYPEFNVEFIVNPDSTVDVVETQTYKFNGQYNLGWRNIPTRIGEWITDVKVEDLTTHTPLSYSFGRLTKTNPSSWGKYTVYSEDGTNIEWYYNLRDTTHTFALSYKLHGAIEFGSQYDRLYWDVLTDFQVPIHRSTVSVKLPGQFSRDQIQTYAYRDQDIPTDQSFSAGNAHLSTTELAPYEDFTIDVTWPKGYVSESDYWKSFLLANFGFIMLPLLLIATVVFCLIFWLRHEYFPSKQKSIIPIYEPPSDLPPAVAGVIINEGYVANSLAATIVDLAVRGYVTIKETKPSFFARLFYGSKDYHVTKTAKFTNEAKFHPFESKFLSVLFDGKDSFSTHELTKSSVSRRREVALQLQKIPDEVYKQVDSSTNAYVIPPKRGAYKWAAWVAIFATSIGAVTLLPLIFSDLVLQLAILSLGLLSCGLFAFSFVKLEPRLNQSGNELKNKWLGFKLYLSVAEKARLQHLTPAMFEKFLPYAMVFGVEKQWSKAFDSILKDPPNWYHGTYVGSFSHGSGSGSFSGGFSASSFGASFSSSFSSSIASSGASGSSGGGGGGGAGGGGGGGGGGAG